jgi:hypothetical protein
MQGGMSYALVFIDQRANTLKLFLEQTIPDF